MKFRLWIKSALAAALAMHCFASLGQAQSPVDRTTLAGAIELVDAHLDKAQHEPNADLKRRMQVEGYLALLSLPSTHRQYEAADRLRAIDEALAEKAASGDREVIEVGLGAARALAEERDDLQRIFLLDRQYSGLSSGEGVNKQYFLQLMRANDAGRDELVLPVDAAGRRRSRGNRQSQRRHRLALPARPPVARTAGGDASDRARTRLSRSGLRLADLGASAEAEQRANRQHDADHAARPGGSGDPGTSRRHGEPPRRQR